MGAAGGVGMPASWRAVATAAVVLCVLPVVLSLVLLWLPLLCCAVAAVRFRRVRMRRMQRFRAAAGGGGGGRWAEKGDTGDRLLLLQKYLDDQMELVGAEAMEFVDPREE